MNHSSAGDPEGRRVARARAGLLSEAGSLLRGVRVLLERAAFPTGTINKVATDVARQEQAELQRSFGRIESRKRFKHSGGHPLNQGRIANHLFIDECGRSNPEPHLTRPVFALAGIAMDEGDLSDYVERADALKLRFFQTRDLTFHEPFMRNFDGMYYFEGNHDKQVAFDAAIDELVGHTKFTAFGVAVRKDAFEEEFRASGIDPYLSSDAYSLAIMMLLERYVDFACVAMDGSFLGEVTFESQGPKEDALHQLEYARLLLEGTQWVPSSAFQQSIRPGVRFVPKSGSHPTELADMFSRELWEWVRAGCGAAPKRWPLFSEKVYRRDSRRMGTFGIKVFPDGDIRDLIETHRDSLP